MVFRSFIELLQAYRHSRENWAPASAMLGRDRRIFQRVPLRTECQLVHPLFGLQSEGVVVNMSLGGAGIVAPVSWPEGGTVLMRLKPSSTEVKAVIVFRQEQAAQFRYGIKFQNIGLGLLIQLRRILRQNYQGPLTV